MAKTRDMKQVGFFLTAMTAAFLFVTTTIHAQTFPPILADFEGGVPADWFQYSDIVTPNVITDTVTGNQLLSVTYDVTAAGFGGFGVNLPSQDWSDYDGISFDFYGEASGETYTFEAQDGAGAVVERFHGTFVDDTAGQKTVVIPFSSFTRSTVFQEGGAPDDGFQMNSIAVWVFPLPVTAGAFQLDNIAVANITSFADFDVDFPDDWFAYGGAVTPTIGADGVLTGTYDIVGGGQGFGGFGATFAPGQDWSDLDGITYWMYGYNSGETFTFEIQDGTPGSTVERFVHTVVDDFEGWRQIVAPFDSFVRSTGFQEGDAPDDGLNLIDIRAWAYPLPNAAGSFGLDNFSTYGDAGNVTLKVGVESADISTIEGGTVIVTVTLSATSTDTVTVDYATSDGTAVAGTDYTAASGTLTFAPGETMQSFTVETADNDTDEDDRTVTIALTNTTNAELSALSSATLTIVDDEMNTPAGGGKSVLLDDFEDGALPMGADADGTEVGYAFYQGGSSTVTITVDVPPEPRPGADAADMALAETLFITSGSFAGYVQNFTNDAADEWLTQNWTSFSGISFWLYGNNTGGIVFLDILDNRSPDSTVDDAERWSLDITDNFSGWNYFEFDWSDFNRKDVGNGAPNDGLDLDAMHGYAFGGFGAQPMDNTYYIDEVRLIQIVETVEDFGGAMPSGTDADGNPVGYYNIAGGGGAIDTMTATAPVPIPGFDATNTTLQLDMTLPSSAFAVAVNAFGNEAMDMWTPQDWSNYEGICFWAYGNNTGGVLFVDVLDNRNPDSTTDDAERWSIDIPDDFSGWQFFQYRWDDLGRKDVGNGAPNDGFNLTEIHGFAFGGFGSVDMGTNTYYVDELSVWGDSGADDPITAEFERNEYGVVEGETAVITITLNNPAAEDVIVSYATAESYAIPNRDYIPTSGDATIPGGDIVLGTLLIPAGATSVSFPVETIDENKADGDQNVVVVLYSAEGAELGFQTQTLLVIEDNDAADPNLIDDFEGSHPFQTVGDMSLMVMETMTGDMTAVPNQGMYEQRLDVTVNSVAETACLDRTFTQPVNWTESNSLSFWFYGSNSGADYTVQLHDNQVQMTADTPSTEWELVWADEFDDPAGTPPNPNVWSHEIGDGTLNDNPGWGNAEFQYYTDDPANASTDGNGNLVIRMLELGTMPDVVLAQNRSMHPEGIEWDAVNQRFLVGSLTMANVFAVADDGTVTPFITSDNLVGGSVGIHIDKTTNRLLVAHSNPNVLAGDPAVTGFAQLGIYDLTTGEELHFVDLTALGATSGRFFANDVTSDADGNAYVTNSESTEIYKVDMDGNAEIFVNNVNANGIEYHPDGYLLAATRSTPGLVNIPLDDPSTIVTVMLSEAARMDGIILNGNGDLIGVAKTQIQADGSAEDEIIQLHSEDGWASAVVVARDTAIPESSPTTVTLRDDIPYVVHANFAGLATGQVVPEFEIMRVINNEADLTCYYGPCRYTSARLITQDKLEFEYGRIESRIQVPPGEDGLWPAFWMLGTDIREVQWPQTGEIDIMEYVSRVPDDIFGTIHGPGFSGGASFGNIYQFGEPVANEFHTFDVEWTPDNIIWHVDGIQYHEAIPSDVEPNEWVFNHPFFMILNMAIGGNFGGTISDEIVFPQELLVDYVRVYQAPNSAEQFEITFTDNSEGWRRVILPFDNFTRSATQPDNAPDDGLTLSAVSGYSIKSDTVGTFSIDQVHVTDAEPTAVAQNNVTVTNSINVMPYVIIGVMGVVLAAVLYLKWGQTR